MSTLNHLIRFCSTPILKLGVSLTMISVLSSGCEDEPPPNDPPVVIVNQASAVCEPRDGSFALMDLSFVIEDLQGSDTLLTPYVEFQSIALQVESEKLPAPTVEERAAAVETGEMLPVCEKESCRVRYTWTYRAGDENSGLLFCEDGDQLLIKIIDENTNELSFYLPVALP